ncbi:hypothetical protein SEPCBS119000_001181 [Sporothrix epigloea]|uniref:PHD-type domain-containing protein n=1 Tax=Sporothrix epigloea TaxID=1892477 RepID=A0ABP0D990_9PEZI
MPPTLPANVRATRSRFSSPMQGIDATGPADAASTSESASSGARQGGAVSTSRPTATSGNNGVTGLNAQRAMMAQWLEPPVQSKSSFEEAGFQRQGVFEGMAPLGNLPKAADLVKRISVLPEEKQYRDGLALQARQTSKQQQKKKELSSRHSRTGSQDQQPKYEAHGENLDHTSAIYDEPNESEKRAQKQTASPTQTKKIILRRPSTKKNISASGVIRPNSEDGENVRDESTEGEMASIATRADNDADITSSPKKQTPDFASTRPSSLTTTEIQQDLFSQPVSATSQKEAEIKIHAPGLEAQSRLSMDREADDLDDNNSDADREHRDLAAIDSPLQRSNAADGFANPREILDSDIDSFDSQAEDDEDFGDKSIAFNSSHLPFARRTSLRPRSDSNATEVNRDVTDRVVDLAVEEALRHHRYPTAWALRTLYDEQSADQTFLTMVEDVFQQTADRETLGTFVRMVHERKKEGKRGNKACHHFNATDNESALRKPIPAPYADLVTLNLQQYVADGSVINLEDTADHSIHANKRVKLTNEAGQQQMPATGLPLVTMHTFAPPQISVPLLEMEPTTAAEYNSHGVKPYVLATPKKTAAKTKTKTLSQSPKTASTPSKASATPRRPPGRPLGSKNKSHAEKAAAAGATTSSGKKRTRKDDSRMTLTSTPSTGRLLRNRSASAASSVSSLSSAMSLTTPSKALRKRKDVDSAVQQQPGGQARNKTDDGTTNDASSNTATTSLGWTAGTVQRKNVEYDGEPKDNDSKRSGNGLGSSAKASTPASQQSAKRGGKGADRRGRGGPGSGRGGRRPGAGRPPKNRALIQPKTPTTESAPAPESATQPIATRNRLSAQKAPNPPSALASSLSSPGQNTTQIHINNTTDSQAPPGRASAVATVAAISTPKKQVMPAAVVDQSVVRPVSVAKRATQNESKKNRNSSAALPASTLNSIDAAPKSLGKSESSDLNEARLDRLRREARNVTNSLGVAPESFFRGGADQTSADISFPEHDVSAISSRRNSVIDGAKGQLVLETPLPQLHRQLRASTSVTRTTRSARKRAFDELADESSPRSSSFSVDEAPPTRLQTPVTTQQSAAAKAPSIDSRAETPGPKPKKQRVGIRIKSSPVKKKTGTFAGMPRASGERGSPVANGVSNTQDDNDDYCASCGGSGDLVCCDGCTRSFHFNCVDPPVHEDRELPDEWFCNVCIGRRNPAATMRYVGIFGALLNVMESRNSSAFRLPSETRNFFEAVKTGPDGEYEDIAVAGTNRSKKRGYEEAPDFYRIRDNDGNPVLCHQCNYSAKDDKPIIPCAFCGLWWHIDCLQPPMANPPVLRNWRCPAHADDILAKLPGQLGPAHRFRKIKGASVIKPAYSRGMINNGFVEFNFDDDSSDNNSGWPDWQSFGRVQRISARGVELDFFERIRKEQSTGRHQRARMRRQQERPEFRLVSDVEIGPIAVKMEAAVQSQRAILHDRSLIDEAQAAHNLSALCTIENADRTGDLINALLAQADSSVISMMAQGSALNIESGLNLSQQDRTSLEAMRARINLLLSSSPTSTLPREVLEHADAGDRENGDFVASESLTTGSHILPSIPMQSARPDESEDAAAPETSKLVSLASANGEIEDKNLPIIIPLDTANKDTGSTAWPVRQRGSSIGDPGSGSKAPEAAVKPDPDARITEN